MDKAVHLSLERAITRKRKRVRIGISTTHDSSAACVDESGIIQFAIQQERISRVKNDSSFPLQAIQSCIEYSLEQGNKVESFHFGQKRPWENAGLLNLSLNSERFPGFDGQYGYIWPPGIKSKFEIDHSGAQKFFRTQIDSITTSYDFMLPESNIFFEDHQESHAITGFIGSGFSSALAISLDGHGDKRSGAVVSFDLDKGRKEIASFKDFDSLGNLYAAVTSRYNFKPVRHEGKITGLASYGQHSAAVDFLSNYIEIQNGIPKFHLPRNRVHRALKYFLRLTNLSPNLQVNLTTLIDSAEENTQAFPDLAYAVQRILEMSVLEIITHWRSATGVKNVVAAGGVFANVSLNARIRELLGDEEFFVFPAMGDAGTAVGSVWNTMFNTGQREFSTTENFFLGPDSSRFLPPIAERETGSKKVEVVIAEELSKGKVLGLIQGRMEFGPRALGNRTVLIDPRDSSINQKVNKRLRRTEFMPFAPICLEKNFEKIFTAKIHQKNFEFMTETCSVRPEFRDLIAAAVHVDGTARPQVILENTNPFLESILNEFELLTGCPALINTSFNLHEEPIIMNAEDAFTALEVNAIDGVVYARKLYMR